jgi:hypothetical protein
MHIDLCGFFQIHSKVEHVFLEGPSLVVENISLNQGL